MSDAIVALDARLEHEDSELVLSCQVRGAGPIPSSFGQSPIPAPAEDC